MFLSGGSAVSTSLSLCLLGPLEALVDGEPLALGGPRQRIILAMLLLEQGRVVSADRLIEAVWAESPPSTARSQVQICVSSLRRSLADVGKSGLIATRPSGYTFHGADAEIDVDRFRKFVVEGRAAAQRLDLASSVEHLRAALALWRGQAVADVESRLVQTFATRLNEERFTVHEECIGLELALGRHGAVIGELSELVVTYPLREKLWAHLMLALYRAGRHGEALAAYRRAQQMFAEELGLDPAEELRALERAILRNDPSLALSASSSAGSPGAHLDRLTVPRQLPAAIPDFVGRTETVQLIRQHLTPGGCRSHGDRKHVEVVVVGGRSGVGKSALALHVAQTSRGHYPDGQLFANLRGNQARSAQPEHLLEQFLRALGVAPALVPERLEDLEALYRSELADRRILVVLDDAANEEQVLPFVPGDAGSALLVTSRQPLAGLQGAHRIDLDVFSPMTSLALLSEVLGETRVRTEPQAAVALAHTCGHLPLALRVAGARLSARGHWSIEQMVGRLTDEGQRLDELTLGEVGVRAGLALSYDGLGKRARRLLLLLGMLGATDFAHWVPAPLLDADLGDSDEVLGELVQARLVEVQAAVEGAVRFHLHDLIRIFAVERLASEIPDSERGEARHRLLRGWLFLATEAHRRQFGDSSVLHSGIRHWALPSQATAGLVEAPLVWFQSEQANLEAAIRQAADNDHDDLCWDLALTMADFFESLGYLDAWKETNGVALQAVRRMHNKRGEAAMLLSRSGPSHIEGHWDDAERDLELALAWFTRAGDTHGRGHVLSNLGAVDRHHGRHDRALSRLQLALTDLRSVHDGHKEAHTLNIIAKIWLERGRYHEAEALLRQALEVCPSGARRARVQLTYWLGEAYLARGELAEAETRFHRVMQVVSELNDPVGKVCALLGLGRVWAARNDFCPAKETLQAALDTADQVGDRIGRCRALVALAGLALDDGDIGSASARLDEYDAMRTERGDFGWPAATAEARERLRSAVLRADVQPEVSEH